MSKNSSLHPPQKNDGLINYVVIGHLLAFPNSIAIVLHFLDEWGSLVNRINWIKVPKK